MSTGDLLKEGQPVATMGGGSFTYGVIESWAKPPAHLPFSSVSDIAVDKQDNVYAFQRNLDHPVMIFDRNGNFLGSWGAGIFKRPHGLRIEADDTIYCTDDADHTVRKFTLEGKLLLTLGVSGQSSPEYSGKPFNRCTHTALSPQGDIYVSDGYRNASVHKFSATGKLLTSWGGSGCDPGQFNIPHNISCDDAGLVYVTDRENHRIQVFDGNGRYEGQWNNLHRPMSIHMGGGPSDLCYIGEVGPALEVNLDGPNLGPRVSILTKAGKVLARLGSRTAGAAPDQFMAPHGITVDSRGAIYVADLGQEFWSTRFPGVPEPPLKTLKKLVKIA